MICWALRYPVVEGTVVFELEGAERVGDAFDRVADAVREVVHGVDAPLVPCGVGQWVGVSGRVG